MTDHAGPRRCECHLVTNFWHPPTEVIPVLAPEERFWRPFFVRPKKIILMKRQGKRIKRKLLEMVSVTFLFHTDEFILVWSFKNGNGRQNRSSGSKTGFLRRTGSKT